MDTDLDIFHKFCGGETFWNGTKFFQAEPEFSLCFMNTVLVWIPCAFIWIASPLFVLRICLSRSLQPLPFAKLNLAKAIISALAAVMIGLQLREVHVSGGKCVGMMMTPALETSCLIKIASFILTIMLQQYQRYKGIKTSAIPFTFWALLVLSEIPTIYTNIYKQKYFFCLLALEHYTYFLLIIVQLVLHCYAEKNKRTQQGTDKVQQVQNYSDIVVHVNSDVDGGGRNVVEGFAFDYGWTWTREDILMKICKSCPEEDVPFVSHMTYSWFSPTIKKIYAGTFDAKKFWALPSRLKNERVAPQLEKAWNEEVNHCETKRLLTAKRGKYRHRNGYGLLDGGDGNVLHRMYMESWLTSEDTPLLSNSFSKKTKQRKRRNDEDKRCLEPNLYKALIKVFLKYWIEAVSFLILGQIAWYMIPLVLQYLIQVIDERDSDTGIPIPMWIAYFCCVAILIFTFANLFFHHTSFTHMLELGLNVKTALMALVYRKALRMKTSGNQTTAVGEIVNYIAVDCQRVQDAFTFSGYSVVLLMVTTLTVLQLWGLMGMAALGCLLLLIVVLPAVGFIGIQQFKIQKELLTLKGSRIKTLNEVINGIKVLKMYSWETSFISKIEAIRSAEVNKLWKYAWLSAISVVLSMHTPVVIMFILIALHVTTSPTHLLEPRQTFTAVTIVNILRFSISLFPIMVNGLVQAYVSVGRIQSFLRTPDIDEKNVLDVKHSEYAISIEDGEFAWKEDQAQTTLKDINLQVKEGELLAVVGQVGSGKSSLISAILGEMERIHGNVKVKGAVAYVPQVAWIQNMKLKDNILFGKEYRQNKYLKVIDACALIPDLKILPGGDETEIGERGINVSGGQKQRISLARAVYNNADIYLLDDPLSAVDSHVGKDLFNNVISNTGLLKNKTRVLVTHGLHWLPMVDRIVVLVDGRISEIGSYTDLICHDGPFAQYVHQFLQEEYENDDNDPEFEEVIERMRHKLDGFKSDGGLVTTDDDFQSSINCERCRNRKRAVQKKEDSEQLSRTIAKSVIMTRLTKDETSEEGAIKPSVFLNFIKAIGIVPFVVFLVCIGLYQGLNMFSNIWLSIWTKQNVMNVDTLNHTDVVGQEAPGNNYIFYLMIYLGLGVLQGIFLYTAFYLILTRMAAAAGKLHNKMLESILQSPSSFFDTTPTGRIINRFSSDVDIMDSKLPLNFRIFSLNAFSVLAILIVVSILTPMFLVNIFLAGIIYALLVRYFLPTVRLLRRLETVRRSPIYNHFSETLTGASVIRAYKCGQRFAEEFRKRLDENSTFYYASFICTRWIGIRVETISNIVILVTNIVTIASGLNGSEVGLSISYAIMITITINVAVFSVSELLMDTVSVERVADYTNLPAEESIACSLKYRPIGWPQTGRIDFYNYMTRYRAGLDLVLKGITLTINTGEKVGVVGRTGAGKSSLTLSLFRMLEATNGSIFIDGEDISKLHLNVLRTNLTILPQDPVLFSGSLRFNLDPFGCFNDKDMWTAIECAHLKQYVDGLHSGLDYECGEGGQNLSIGQRQLVCLARTLLHKTRILILDEATAAVDIETDELIQETIRKQFKECTVLTIAHRLHTVMDYDRVVVMEGGCIKEIDAPQALLQNPNTIFYGMAKDAGLV